MLRNLSNVAIIGAAGRMGRWLCRFLSSEGFTILANDIDDKGLSRLKVQVPDINICGLRECVVNSDLVIISVPIDSIEFVVRGISNYVRDDHLVIDICSIKELPVNIMHKYLRCNKLGTHPLFGPGIKSLKGKAVILTPVTNEELNLSLEIVNWLESRGAYGVLMSPADHDELVRLLIGIPHIVGILLARFLSKYDLSTFKVVKTPTFNFMLNYALAIVSGNLELSVNIHKYLNTADDLKKLVEMANDLPREISQRASDLIKELQEISAKFFKEGVVAGNPYDAMYSLFNSL